MSLERSERVNEASLERTAPLSPHLLLLNGYVPPLLAKPESLAADHSDPRPQVDDDGPALAVLIPVAHQLHGHRITVGVVADQDVA